MHPLSRTLHVPVMNTARATVNEPQPISCHSQYREVRPLVSIICITFNHEHFIQDTINGFLKQRTTFPVEILIHDDASSDRTAEIIRKYYDSCPGLIKPVFQKVNQYSQGIQPDITSLARARGKYVAFCEGDDYWTDPDKLEKQVRFLQENPDYSASFGGFTRLHETSRTKSMSIIGCDKVKKNGGFPFTLNEMMSGWLTKTLTAVVRRDVIEETDFTRYRHFRDIHLFYHVVKGRKAWYFPENFGVYRIHPGGINSMQQGRVNANAAYNCYRELYLHNNDEFTRVMCFKSTVSLFNYNLFNWYQGNNVRNNLRLAAEMFSMFKGYSEFKMIVYSLIKRQVKDYIKFHIQ